MNRWRFLLSLSVFGLLIFSTITILFLARGYRIDLNKKEIAGTGIIVATSTPDGALVYLNDIPTSATNTSLTGLKPNTYTIRMEKQGFFSWTKEIVVKKELVTKVDALLVPLFPNLDPLTSGNAQNPLLAPDGQKIVYTSTQNGQSGIWVLELVTRPFNLGLRPSLILTDTNQNPYSTGELTWAPDSKSLILKFPNSKIAFLFDINSKTLTELNNHETLLKEWEEISRNSLESLLASFDKETQDKISHLPNPIWSPDNTKIMYTRKTEDQTKFMILDLKPIDFEKKEPEEFTVYAAPKEQFTKLTWYPDSEHLFILSKEKLENSEGIIKIIETDGENENQIFSGTIMSDHIFPYPNGSKIVILTTFSPESNQYNLYSINLR